MNGLITKKLEMRSKPTFFQDTEGVSGNSLYFSFWEATVLVENKFIWRGSDSSEITNCLTIIFALQLEGVKLEETELSAVEFDWS